MQELLTYIAQHIVTQPEAVVVTEDLNEDSGQTTLHLSVHPEDMGLVIGREGNTARALRNVIKVAAARHNVRVYLDIVDDSQPSEA